MRRPSWNRWSGYVALNADDKRQIWRAMEVLDKITKGKDPVLKMASEDARNLLEKILTEINKRDTVI